MSSKVNTSDRVGRIQFVRDTRFGDGHHVFICGNITRPARYVGQVDGWETFRADDVDELLFCRAIPVERPLNAYMTEEQLNNL